MSEPRPPTNSVGQTLQMALRGIEQANPETLYGIFGDAQRTTKDHLFVNADLIAGGLSPLHQNWLGWRRGACF